MLPSIEQRLALELAAKPAQVAAAIALLDEGATVPFIARYRKEATGGLDDIQLRLLEERLRYLRELEDRRAAIIASIEEQGKMTPELLRRRSRSGRQDAAGRPVPAVQAESAAPRRRSRIEAGLAAAGRCAAGRSRRCNPEEEAAKYLQARVPTDNGDNPGVADTKAALDGARQILMERFAEDATLLQSLREYLQEHGVVESKVVEGKEDAGAKFADYFDYSETDRHHSLASRAGAVPRPPRGNARRLAAAGYRGRKTEVGRAAQSLRRPHRRALRHHATRAARPTNGCPTRCAGPGA